MKRILVLLLALCLLVGCAPAMPAAPVEGGKVTIAATTAPIAQFTAAIVEGTSMEVQCVVSERVSCLHDYTLSVEQMMLLENADAVVISGLGLEDFLDSALPEGKTVIDASRGVDDVIAGDPHIWLDPDRAEDMAETICKGLCRLYPEYTAKFEGNLRSLEVRFEQLDNYAEKLEYIRCPGLVTFHDGFRYFADFIDVPLLASMEVEAGSEPAAKDLMDIIQLVRDKNLPAVFVEVNANLGADQIVSQETGCKVFILNTAMSGDSDTAYDYFTAMTNNIDAVWEAFQ